jgi:hypothetical protein
MGLIGQLGDVIEVSIALDLDAHQDEIVDDKVGIKAVFVNVVTVGKAAVSDKEFDNFASGVVMCGAVCLIYLMMEAPGLCSGNRVGALASKTRSKGNLKFLAHSRNATDKTTLTRKPNIVAK